MLPSRDGLAHGDAERVYMSEKGDPAAVVGLVVQAALIGAGSLEPRIVVRLLGRNTAARRYLTLETSRAVHRLADCVPVRVVDTVSRHWAGPMPVSAEESLRRASSREAIPLAPECFGVLRAGAVVRSFVLGAPGIPGLNDKGTRERLRMEEVREDEDSDVLRIFKRFSLPIGWDNALSPFLRNRIARFSARPGFGKNGGGAELPVSNKCSAGDAGPYAVLFSSKPDIGGAGAGTIEGGKLYPEWDVHRQSYRDAWCCVREYDPAPGDLGGRIGPSSEVLLRRDLAQIGLGFATHRRQSEGESLDQGAVLDYLVGRSLGEMADERIYESRRRTARDLGVLILLDASGSTAERAGTAQVWEEQRRLAASLTTALESLGDRVATCGFRSTGRHDVRFLRIKDFDGRFDQNAQARLGALKPSGFTRLGAGIRHAAHLVTTRAGTSHLLIVVISDGFPYEEDYQGAYAEHDTRRALSEAVERGVGLVCLGVGASTEKRILDNVWGHVTHARLTNADELAGMLQPLFRAALRAAANTGRGLSDGCRMAVVPRRRVLL